MLARIDAAVMATGPNQDRRGSERHRLTTLRVAKLRCLSGEYVCIIQDVSETGTKLRMFHEHPPETFMFLELSNGEFYPVERRWTDGEFAGFRFANAIKVDEIINTQGPEGRRPITLRVEYPAKVTSGDVTSPAVIMELSPEGACLSLDRKLPLRAMVRVEIPGMLSRIAHVCARKDNLHQVVFQHPFALKELAGITMEMQPYRPQPAIAAAPVVRSA